jgi:hypothetical protein
MLSKWQYQTALKEGYLILTYLYRVDTEVVVVFESRAT